MVSHVLVLLVQRFGRMSDSKLPLNATEAASTVQIRGWRKPYRDISDPEFKKYE
jgi:hypothetical protein